MYSYGSQHMAAQKQGDQLERTFSSYVRIQDVVLKTYLGRWTIGRSGERGSGISVLPARYDDDDDVFSLLNSFMYCYLTLNFIWYRSFVRTQLNGFKYGYLTQRIRFNVNHLFVYHLNSFKYCCLSAIDPQPLPSCTFNIKSWCLLPTKAIWNICSERSYKC